MAIVTFGPEAGKYVVIVDIIDQGRALVEGPSVKRQSVIFRRMQLTDIVLTIPRGIGSHALAKAFVKQDLAAKFQQTPWGKKQAVRAKRASMTDFDRFKLMLAKKQRRVIVYREVKKIKKASA